MITGMTGFGSTEFTASGVRGTVEVKSVNHRYLDIGYYLPTGFAAVENRIRQLIEEKIERGRVIIAIKITNKPQLSVHFNKEVAKTYLKYAHILKKELNLKGDLSLSDIIQLPGIVETKETTIDPEVLWPAFERAITGALKSLVTMRKREGSSLAKDISEQLKRMSLQVNMIQTRAKFILKEKKKTLNGEEFSSLEKSSDVNEELKRLAHHVDELKLLLKTDTAAGKKIDFIAQEMQRETNTIGSKLQDKHISNAVIALKSKIEKIREQSQNVE
ncbi:MAG: YicC/YloC family endoribonuclease [Candidatus Omnitrophota bacterium]